MLAWVAAVAGTVTVARRTDIPLPFKSWTWIVAITLTAVGVAQAWRTPGLWVLAELAVLAGGVLAALRGAGVISASDVALAWFLVSRRRAPEAAAQGEAEAL